MSASPDNASVASVRNQQGCLELDNQGARGSYRSETLVLLCLS